VFLPGILGEVRCLKLELDSERSRAEQEQDTAARQLARAEQEGQTALEQQKVAHEEEVNQLLEKWVGGGHGWGVGEADLASRQ
jgi:centrosomal protein CEP250